MPTYSRNYAWRNGVQQSSCTAAILAAHVALGSRTVRLKASKSCPQPQDRTLVGAASMSEKCQKATLRSGAACEPRNRYQLPMIADRERASFARRPTRLGEKVRDAQRISSSRPGSASAP
jgi:hypothetical protein